MAVAEWITLTLDNLKAPHTPTNIVALEDWALSEGMPADSNNPLAASDQIEGAKPTPGFSEPSYPSAKAAAALYAKKLTSPTYEAIGFSLISGQDLNIIYTNINRSPWCQGCQGGDYPIVLYRQLYGGEGPVLEPHSTTGPGGFGAGSQLAGELPGLFGGWADLQRAVNRRLPKALTRAQHANHAAQALLRHRAKGG